MPNNTPPVNPACEIVSTRLFNTPREKVYKAWTDPDRLKVWWGPNGFTNTFNLYDLRVGGRWSFIMHGPEKGNYHNECEFTIIEPPSVLAWKRHSKPLFNVHVTFEEQPGDTTKLVFRMIFDTPEECNKIKPFAVEKNEENFDRLEGVLRDEL